ncbi:non-muscle caldesmon isoform X2 [Cynoglossus semilaevis]|uniref:non-muscle caldesmon isoform X2 n=1 Tax=Cynoglossus semilaevis TaxID=244447 RepID=UPI000D623488|nr:non-muscle caldesmon-like isoform X2 [Cynoglossus semilaevis]
MSNTLLRRNSSKQGLQNLMRLTAQRSIEDAEEVERERRRRAREASQRRNSGSTPGECSPEGEVATEENMYDSDFKPSISPSLDEDEGFSDWTQRRERQRQQRLQELSHGGDEDDEEEESTISKAAPVKTLRASVTSSSQIQKQEQGEMNRARMETEKRNKEAEEAVQAEKARLEKQKEDEVKREEMITRRREEAQRPKTEEKRKEIKVSYTSKVFLHQEPKLINTDGAAATEEVTPHVSKTKSKTTEPEEAEAILETEQRLEKIRRSLQVKENQELEQLKHRQAEAEQELVELKKRREERRMVREEEERRREEEEKQRLAKEEEERRRMKEDIERRRMEAAERMKSLSTSSVDGDETFSPFSPKTPTHKITERTESLSRSLKKSNSFKKTQPLVLTSKIDDKLEQYTHAVENSQETRAVKAAVTDLPSSPEVVASKKNLFEAGEAWIQSPTKGATCKDANGLKVGVANLITQWVKGPSDDGRQLPSRSSDVKPGDVMQKKNMWEIIGDSSGRQSLKANKGSLGSKKYKFVVTGHGKYEKIPVDDDDTGGEFTNGKSDLCDGAY